MDFTSITAAIDTVTVLGGITAAAALKMSPNVAKWGYSKVINWFSPR